MLTEIQRSSCRLLSCIQIPEVKKRRKEGQRTSGERERIDKNWSGRERRRLLLANAVSGVSCCTAACVLLGTEGINKLCLKYFLNSFFFQIEKEYRKEVELEDLQWTKWDVEKKKKSSYKGDEAAHSIFKQQRVFEVLYSVSFTIHIRFLLLI